MAQSNKVMQWTANTLINNTTIPNGGYAIGAVGSSITNNGSGNYSITNSSSAIDASLTVNQGKMVVSVPLEINGLDVEQVLKDLMQVTGVINRNRNLEEEFKGLKKAGEAYEEVLRNAQVEINQTVKRAAEEYRIAEEKYKTFKSIKESK